MVFQIVQQHLHLAMQQWVFMPNRIRDDQGAKLVGPQRLGNALLERRPVRVAFGGRCYGRLGCVDSLLGYNRLH